MTKFFLQGPVGLLSKDSPINGMISLPFVSLFCLNCMFGFRVMCIESAIFSFYKFEQLYLVRRYNNTITIDPIVPPEYRMIVYLIPGIISFIINFTRLVISGAKFKRYIKKYPQILISCMFTPFMFEGSKDSDCIRIWKLGTMLNAFFIGCFPQIVLLMMDFYRGVINWDFIGLDLSLEVIYENNNALIKTNYGNIIFAATSGICFFLLIIFTFYTDKIFKNKGMYCKCCYMLCLPCPENCFHLNNLLPTTLPSEKNSNQMHDESDTALQNLNFDDTSKDAEDIVTQIYVYKHGKITWVCGKPLSAEKLELDKVCIKFFLLFCKKYNLN